MEQSLALALLIAGTLVFIASIDDFLVDLFAVWTLKTDQTAAFTDEELRLLEQATPDIAIFVANWREADVLGAMVERNLKNFTAKQVQFVLGVYPNDTDTLAVARAMADKYPDQVRVVVNRKDGPTSKGQMLNEMFNVTFADRNSAPSLVLMHDSEDVIDPDSFAILGIESRKHAMVQVPIFSLDSRHRSLVAATYMDEFAERHTREIRVRQALGAFVPSAGVGTCLRKDLIIHFLDQRGYVLQPGSVTEDYVLGAEAYQAGFSTGFAFYRRMQSGGSAVIATREYFPKNFWASIKQRTRWTYGIGFESSRRLGWFGNYANRFFLYRDRKGALVNLLPLISLFLFGLLVLIPPDFSGLTNWQMTLLAIVLFVNTMAIVLRIAIKCYAMHHIYDRYDLLGVILRWPVALTINAFAVLRAWRSFVVESKWATRPVAWSKTQHELPVDFGLAFAQKAYRRAADGVEDYRRIYRRRGLAAASIVLIALAFALARNLPGPAYVKVAVQHVAGTEYAALLLPEQGEGERLSTSDTTDGATPQLATQFATEPSPVNAPNNETNIVNATETNSAHPDKATIEKRMQSTAESLAELSIAASSSHDAEIIATQHEHQKIDANMLASLLGTAKDDNTTTITTHAALESKRATAETSTEVYDHHVIQARLHQTATALAEQAITETQAATDLLLASVEPIVVDAAVLARYVPVKAKSVVLTSANTQASDGRPLYRPGRLQISLLHEADVARQSVQRSVLRAKAEDLDIRSSRIKAPSHLIAATTTDELPRDNRQDVTAQSEKAVADLEDVPTNTSVVAAIPLPTKAPERQATPPASANDRDARRTSRSVERKRRVQRQRSARAAARIKSRRKAKSARRKATYKQKKVTASNTKSWPPTPPARRATTFLRGGCPPSGCGFSF